MLGSSGLALGASAAKAERVATVATIAISCFIVISFDLKRIPRTFLVHLYNATALLNVYTFWTTNPNISSLANYLAELLDFVAKTLYNSEMLCTQRHLFKEI